MKIWYNYKHIKERDEKMKFLFDKALACATVVCILVGLMGCASVKNTQDMPEATEVPTTVSNVGESTSVTATSSTTVLQTTSSTGVTTIATESTLPSKKTTTKETTATTKKQNIVEVKNDVPYYDQTNYKHVAYGKYGTVSSHGCAIVCISMIASFLKGDGYTPETLAEQFGSYNTKVGSVWELFPDSAEQLDIGYGGMTYDKQKAIRALESGKLVISGQKNSVFSTGGHFILLTGITKDGKIMVNDPYGPNYTKSDYMKKGFAEGFKQSDVLNTGSPFWIYG